MSKQVLKISDDVWLPIDAVTQTFGIFAKRGVGKTFLAGVLAEEMLKHRQQVVILDPTGASWGLKSSANGKAAGFPLVIFGGDHGDVPLEARAGELVADFVVNSGSSVTAGRPSSWTSLCSARGK